MCRVSRLDGPCSRLRLCESTMVMAVLSLSSENSSIFLLNV